MPCAGVLGARCLLVRRKCFKMVSASKTVRNGARLRRSSLDTVCRVNPPRNDTMRAWGPLEQRRSAGERGGGWRLRLVAVADSGAADRSVGSDSARAAVPGSLAGLPRFFRSVAHGGRGCNPGPRAWGARRGRAVACARGVVAWRAACGCAATTYRGLRPGGYCASGACSTRRVASIAPVVVCGRRPDFARRRRHVRQQDSPRDYQE